MHFSTLLPLYAVSQMHELFRHSSRKGIESSLCEKFENCVPIGWTASLVDAQGFAYESYSIRWLWCKKWTCPPLGSQRHCHSISDSGPCTYRKPRVWKLGGRDDTASTLQDDYSGDGRRYMCGASPLRALYRKKKDLVEGLGALENVARTFIFVVKTTWFFRKRHFFESFFNVSCLEANGRISRRCVLHKLHAIKLQNTKKNIKYT